MKWEWTEWTVAAFGAASSAVGAALKGIYDWSRARRDDDRELRDLWRKQVAQLLERLEREEAQTDTLRTLNAELQGRVRELEASVAIGLREKSALEEQVSALVRELEGVRERVRVLEQENAG